MDRARHAGRIGLRLLMGWRDRLVSGPNPPWTPAFILRKTVIFRKPPGGWRLSGGFPSQSAVLTPLGFQPQATGLGNDGYVFHPAGMIAAEIR